MNDVRCCVWILCADLTCSRSFHLSVPVELSFKSPNDGNHVGGGIAGVASALSWTTKTVSIYICVSRCCCYLEKRKMIINSRWRCWRCGKFKMVVHVLRKNPR